MTVQEQIVQYLYDTIEGSDCFLVDYKVKPTNNYKFYIDSDTGFTLEKCMKINRAIRRKVEEAALFPDGDISIEVSSPGIDAPLKLVRQFQKNIGRKLEIELLDVESSGIIGKLLEAGEDEIKIEKTPIIRRGKKEANSGIEILTLKFDEIKTATVLIEF